MCTSVTMSQKNTRRCSVWTKHIKHTNFGSLIVSGKPLTYPSPKPTLTLTSHLGQNVGLGEGYVGRCYENLAKIHCYNLRNPESVITYSKPCSSKIHRWCKSCFSSSTLYSLVTVTFFIQCSCCLGCLQCRAWRRSVTSWMCASIDNL